MKLLAISEHYFPRLGGTVNYLHETLSALTRQGVEVELWVPGPEPFGWQPEGNPPPYSVVWLDAGYPPLGDPSRAARYRFCAMVNEAAQARALGPNSPDILHLVFGLFVMEVLDTDALRRTGLHSVVTVHNVTPQECRMVTQVAPLPVRIKEEARLQVVGWKNRARLRAHRYDAVIVPSAQVRDLLAPVLKRQKIDVIGHGPTGDLLAYMALPASRRPDPGAPLRLLTVGGYAPHKRQHLIPDVANRLHKQGIDVEWDVVGPEGRIAGYHDSVRKAAQQAGLGDRLRIHGAVPFTDLAQLYDAAHLYVQPSVEEGFCITALDAAAAGLPVIASPAGALARIAEVSGGTLVDSEPGMLAQAVADFVLENRWADVTAQAQAVRNAFSWDAAARALMERYASLIKQRVSNHA